jgi:hypothetical protein
MIANRIDDQSRSDALLGLFGKKEEKGGKKA